MLLQFAVGPVCLYLFTASLAGGIRHALPGVVAAMLADAFYMGLAVLGFGGFLTRSAGARKALRFSGAGILVVFGLASVLGGMGYSIMPKLELADAGAIDSIFVATLVLTLSNPLSIVFWLGVLSTRMAQDGMARRELSFFCAGCLLATLFFLTLIVVLGRVGGWMLLPSLVPALNIVVGIALIAFGVKSALRKT